MVFRCYICDMKVARDSYLENLPVRSKECEHSWELVMSSLTPEEREDVKQNFFPDCVCVDKPCTH